MTHRSTRWPTFALRVITCHTATYFVAGLLALWWMDYAELWQRPEMSQMRPLDSPWVAAGPGLQPIRGLVLAAVLYPFRSVFLERSHGWFPLWALLVGVGILSTWGPSPGSIEGLIYTTYPLGTHLRGLPEVLIQSLLLSLCLVTWSRRPGWGWGLVLGGLTALAVLASLAGVLLAP